MVFRRSVVARLSPHLAFASFGVFWGSWGAVLPSIKTQAELTDGELGTALLCVGVGALPAMRLTGRLIDRHGVRGSACCLALLSTSAVMVAMGSKGAVSVAICMLVVGASSGAADVAINTMAGDAERRTSRPVLTRAHGSFSAAVVVSSLGMGALAAVGANLLTSLGIAALTGLALSALVWTGASLDHADRRESTGVQVLPPALPSTSAGRVYPLLALGLVGALAYATENAHQSWGAILITDVYASHELAALAPATFAATAAVTRLSLAPLSRSHPVAILTGGGAVACVGTVVLAAASNVPMALGGLAIAAGGTALLFPTLLSHGLRSVAPGVAGEATSIVATTAYLGYLAGPAYVGLLAERAGIRAAFLGVGFLILVFTATAALTGRWSRQQASSTLALEGDLKSGASIADAVEIWCREEVQAHGDPSAHGR
ncbi:MFS transporter [Nocardioides jensenii]|uniref:MFS transporter n=1 Tax=Nocardioides jensenii TaxID=1843 RepID=UPI000AE036A5|nr:MFS transporter [Nocardioides jensenii]